MSGDLRRQFASREDLIAYVREQFPDAAARDDAVSPILGGRKAALDALSAIDPARYAATRNSLDGAVTRLSPYIRHGVLSLAEVRQAAIERIGSPSGTYKLIQELAWRDYWRRLYGEIGVGVWQDREPYKTGYRANHYQSSLPEEIDRGETGLACMDAFSLELRQTGYLHNHARMWVAAWLVHWRGVRWQAGARWFLRHLLDGDPASNNLSWQWVASTFSTKPYIFNRENLVKYTANRYCPACPLRNACPIDAPYDHLQERLFPNLPAEPRRHERRGR
ncbi:MAG: FAD-binding domain-containing protein [Thermomicrobiales bacterium]